MSGSRGKIRPLITSLALAIALVVAITMPAGYFWVATSEAENPRSALIQTGVVALLSALLGFAVFYVLRILPMRIIDRTLSELATVEARYHLLFDSSPFPTVVVDQATRSLLAVNQATINQYGWSREELLTMSGDDFYPPQDLAGVLQARTRFMTDPKRVVPPLRHRRKDGTLLDVEQTALPIEFAGRPAVLVTAHDVTERNHAMKELRDSEQKYQTLVETLPVGVVETTTSNRIVTANAAWRRMFGFSDSEDLGAIDVQMLYADPQERRTVVDTVSVAGTLPPSETVFRRRDGVLFQALRYLRSVANDEGKVVALRGIVIDITRRKSLEAQLNQAQKMEAIGQLTGGIAHDLNNIMTVILANTDALHEVEGLAPATQKRIGRISKASERASDLTRSLLAFAHKLPLTPKRLDLNVLVGVTANLMRRTLGTPIEVMTVQHDDLWLVEVDRGQFENALVNLCLNARDAMPSGGRLLIETANVHLDKDRSGDAPGAAPGDYVRVCVIDTGTGIPPAALPRVFEPFFTTKEVGKGTGLGLSMVHGFIKQSKGHIDIQSELGHGTSITIYLPRSDEADANDDTLSATRLPRGRESILFVEDEPPVREAVLEQLQSLGYAVTAAANGAAGLAACQAAARPYDLLLTDIVMPGLDGKALAHEVTRRWPRTPVLFMSGHGQAPIVHDGQAGRLLIKPFRKVDLALAVRQTLDGASG